MARPYRLKFKDACYLVTLTGVDGLGLFVEKPDAAHFVELLDLIARKHQVILHAYGLAENRAALVLETPKANLSLYLQGVQTAFARHIRQYYVHQGPIMKDRYRAKLLEKSEVLADACTWAHCFPMLEDPELTTAARIRNLGNYPFSSFLYTVGEKEEGITSATDLLRAYGSPAKQRGQAHRRACEEMIRDGAAAWRRRLRKSPVAVGSDDFVKSMEQKHTALVSGKRVQGVRVYGTKEQGISRNKVLEAAARVFGVEKQDFRVQRHGSVLRPVISAFLYQYAAMTQKEIATFLGLGSAAAVSLQIKQLLTLREQDAELDQKCRKLEKSFAGMR